MQVIDHKTGAHTQTSRPTC